MFISWAVSGKADSLCRMKLEPDPMNLELPQTPDAPPATIAEFRERLAAVTDTLPRRLQACATHVAANMDRIAVSTVAELATRAGVAPSAFMRFCQILGFSGFSEMQRLFRDSYAPPWPDYATRLENLKSAGPGTPGALVAEFVEAGHLSLESLAKSLDEAALAQSVATLTAADTIHIIGSRRAYPVAAYLAYVFEKMQVPCILHDGVGRLDHRGALRQGDALLAISFAPYAPETLSLVDAARDAGLPVVAITDHSTSPLMRAASVALFVPEVDFGAFRSLSATWALSLALAVAVGAENGRGTRPKS
jgi:DNA-binding MurR/RpiR family transcriptional regulator